MVHAYPTALAGETAVNATQFEDEGYAFRSIHPWNFGLRYSADGIGAVTSVPYNPVPGAVYLPVGYT